MAVNISIPGINGCLFGSLGSFPFIFCSFLSQLLILVACDLIPVTSLGLRKVCNFIFNVFTVSKVTCLFIFSIAPLIDVNQES